MASLTWALAAIAAMQASTYVAAEATQLRGKDAGAAAPSPVSGSTCASVGGKVIGISLDSSGSVSSDFPVALNQVC